jgi:hypothetical protein
MGEQHRVARELVERIAIELGKSIRVALCQSRGASPGM